MTNQEWINGVFTESETDYKIAGLNILYKNEENYLVKGVELLCDELNPSSVLEFGFGKGWTATEFQRKGVTRHVILEPNKENYQMALTWKANYSTDIEIFNIFSWDYEGGEDFDLVYDDRQEVISETDHEAQMEKILTKGQWYAGWSMPCDDEKFSDYPIYFNMNNQLYVQALKKFGEYLPWQR
jgi:hypothetical protein